MGTICLWKKIIRMVDTVQMDALAALKIIRHCRESLPRLAAGQLLGLDVESTLEVTNYFAFLLEMDAQSQDVSSVGFDRFDLESAVYLEKNMEYLLSAIDTFNYSQSHYIYFKKRLAHRDEAFARRRAENEARVADGLKPLPESDIYKRFGSNLPDISSRLESLLVSSNVDNYCLQLNSFVEQAITRVYTTEAIQK